MKVNYKGFEIEANRKESLAGYSMIYYSVFRKSDDWELTSSYEDSEDTIRDIIEGLKNIVDDYIENPEDYEDEEYDDEDYW